LKPYYDEAGIQLYHGDALEVGEWLAGDGEFAGDFNAVATDPPYSSGTRREGQKGVRKSMNRTAADDEWFTTDCLTTNGFLWLMRSCARQWKRLLVPGGHVLSFIDWRMMPALAGSIESSDMRHVGLLVWDKTYFGMGHYFRNQHELVLHFTNGRSLPPQRKDVGNVLRYPPVRDGEHDTQKPIELMQALVSVVCPVGGKVFDPFAGSGSTLLAAKLLGCRAVGVEADEGNCEIAANRLKQGVLFGAGGAA
jgi:site-specific DNA-methyltransferase (adenine-specific)